MAVAFTAMDGDLQRGVRAAVVAYILWGLLTIYWKQLTGLDAFELIGWRMGTAAVFMAIVVTVQGRWAPLGAALRDRRTARNIAIASVLLLVNWTTYVGAVVSDHVIETALGYFLAPLGTMALGVFVLGETLTPLKRASITLAVIASVVLTVSYGRLPWIALLLAGSWSWYGLTKRRVALGPIESLTSELLLLALPALGIVVFGMFRVDGIPAEATGRQWAFLLGTGVITAIPLLMFAYAAKRVPFTVLGPTNYLVPIINFLLGWLLYDEQLPLTAVVGFVLVWSALALATVDLLRNGSRRPAPHPVPVR